MATLEDVERRLQQAETRLLRQRRLTAGLAALAVVGLLAALRPPEPEVLRARRLEIVDGEERVVGAFGVGAFEAIGGRHDGERLGWFLLDPVLEALAMVQIDETEVRRVGQDAAGQDRSPSVILQLEAGAGVAQIGASDISTYIGVTWDDAREASLAVQPDRSVVSIGRCEGLGVDEPQRGLLHLSYTTGKPTIQAWDDAGQPTIDLE